MKPMTVSFYSNITLLLNLTQQQIRETYNFNYMGPKEGNKWLFANAPSDFHEIKINLWNWTLLFWMALTDGQLIRIHQSSKANTLQAKLWGPPLEDNEAHWSASHQHVSEIHIFPYDKTYLPPITKHKGISIHLLSLWIF